MKFFNFFKKKTMEPETKSHEILSDLLQAIETINNYSSVIGTEYLSFQKAINYYKTIHPLAKSINMISKGFSQIKILLENKETGDYIDDHPLLDLLNIPNADFSGTEMRRQLSRYYLLLGNTFLEATGNPSRPPLELFCKQPQYVQIEANMYDGFADRYEFFSNTKQTYYYREIFDGRFRFYSSDKLKELWHIRDFNPDFSCSDLMGEVTIKPIVLELEQFLRSSNHNLATLINGARLSGILTSDGNMTDKQYERLKKQIQSLTGDKNAGKLLFLESGGGKMNYKEMSQTNKDMDFKENKNDVRNSIFSHYDIPLPLVSPDQMTMDNYKEAKTALYDDAILPLTDLLFEEMTLMLIPRYQDLKKYKLSYNKQDITALLARSNEDIKNKTQSQVLTVNEIRTLYNYEPITDGDELYIPSNLVKIGSETAEEDEADPKADKNEFATILRKRGFNENQISKAIEKHYGK